MTSVPPINRLDSGLTPGITRSSRSNNLSSLAADTLPQTIKSRILSGHRFEHLIPMLRNELSLSSYAELLLVKTSLKDVISRPELETIQEAIHLREKIHIAETIIRPLFQDKPTFAYDIIESEILLIFQWFTDLPTIVLAALNIYKLDDTQSHLKERFLVTILKMAVHLNYVGNLAEEVKPLTNACLDCKEIKLTTYTEAFLEALKHIPMDVFFSLVMYNSVSHIGSYELTLLDTLGFKSYVIRTTPRVETKPIIKWEKILSHVSAKKKISEYAALLAGDLRKQCIGHLKQISFKDLHHQVHIRLTDYYNQLSRYVAENILNNPTVKGRLHLTEFWLEVADHLEKLHDYHSVFSIVSGLTRIEIDRLKTIWSDLSEKHKILNSSLRELCSLEHNYSNLKKRFEELEKASIPYIPFMAILLKDLTLIDQGNPDFIDGRVNPIKRELLLKQLFQFKIVQKKVNEEKPFETDFCFALNAKKRTGSDLLLNKSYEIQPPAITTA